MRPSPLTPALRAASSVVNPLRRVAVCIAGTAATFAVARPMLLSHVIDPNAVDATVDVYAAVLWQGERAVQRKAMAEFGTLPGVVWAQTHAVREERRQWVDRIKVEHAARAACGRAIDQSTHVYDGVLFTSPQVVFESEVHIPTAWADNTTILIPWPPGYRCSDGRRSLNAPLESVYASSSSSSSSSSSQDDTAAAALRQWPNETLTPTILHRCVCSYLRVVCVHREVICGDRLRGRVGERRRSEGGDVPPYTLQRDVCIFGHWPSMCFKDHCDYGALAGLSDKVAVGSREAMRRYAETSALKERGAFDGLSPERMYWQHLVGTSQLTVRPLPVGYSVDSTGDHLM